MIEADLKIYLKKHYGQENEAVEWKAWTGNFNVDGKPKDDLGSYVSALANEGGGFLIIGVEDTTLDILGVSKNKTPHEAEIEILDKTYPKLKITISQIETSDSFKKVWIVEIPKHPLGEWVSFHKPYQRSGESLIELTQSRKDEIRSELNYSYDWSSEICDGATFDDFDEEAVEMAKEGYIKKQYPNNPEEAAKIKDYSIQRFLDLAFLLNKKNQITNTAILLLGKKSALTKLDCGFAAEISFKELTFNNHPPEFTIPFQKSIYEIVDLINLKNIEIPTKFLGQYTGNNTVLTNYDKLNLRECVANCIAHQDYSKHERVRIYETIHRQIVFQNAGISIYSKPEFQMIRLGKLIPKKYRNEFLSRAMREIGLMENKGSGHNKIYLYNTTKVYLPLPEIDWKNTEDFVLTIYGSSIDQNFAAILQEKFDLEPEKIILLDEIQKTHKLPAKIFYQLKKEGLVEGTPTKGKLSFDFMKRIGKEDQYLDQNEDEQLKMLIYKKIKHAKNCSRVNVEDYIYPKLSNKLTEKQKYIKLTNLLAVLKKEGWIDNVGGRKYAIWVIKKPMKLE